MPKRRSVAFNGTGERVVADIVVNGTPPTLIRVQRVSATVRGGDATFILFRDGAGGTDEIWRRTLSDGDNFDLDELIGVNNSDQADGFATDLQLQVTDTGGVSVWSGHLEYMAD